LPVIDMDGTLTGIAECNGRNVKPIASYCLRSFKALNGWMGDWLLIKKKT